MLKLESVRFQYPGSNEHYRFSLCVAPGEITCISGRSGSGKSTLLDLIAGFLMPSQGELWWSDINFTTEPPDKRPVTTVFQHHNLFDHRNAVDNVVVGINPKIPKRGTDVERAKDALSSVGLENFYQTRVSQLSGGQQQRVAIARAILRDSRVILLDEPFSALDPQTRSEMLTLVRELATNKQRTIVMVTHDLRDCEAIADSHHAIEDGQLIVKTIRQANSADLSRP